MQLTRTHKILIAIITLLILATMYMMFVKKTEAPVGDSIVKTSTSTTTTIPGTNIVVEGNGNYTVTPVQTKTEKPIAVPDLNRQVNFLASLNLGDDVKKILTYKISTEQNNLKKDSNNINAWINLGIYQKMAGDYAGAVISWKYVSEISNDFASLGNLGDLYAYYLKDNGMSEVYYKKAIARAPNQAYLYIQLSSVYKEVFNDLAKAKAILDEGLKKMPNDKSLLEAKKNL
jgi:tetratricopeptide (TPR) repeat protein